MQSKSPLGLSSLLSPLGLSLLSPLGLSSLGL